MELPTEVKDVVMADSTLDNAELVSAPSANTGTQEASAAPAPTTAGTNFL